VATRLLWSTIRLQNARQVNFIYVTALLDGSDVITRRYPARQHNVGTVSSPTHRRCERVTGNLNFLPAVRAARFKAHTPDTGAASLACRPTKGLYSIPRATHFSRPRPPSIYKNNLSPTQFVLPSIYYTKRTYIIKT